MILDCGMIIRCSVLSLASWIYIMSLKAVGGLITLNPLIPDCQVAQFSPETPDLQWGEELPCGTTMKVHISTEEFNRHLAQSWKFCIPPGRHCRVAWWYKVLSPPRRLIAIWQNCKSSNSTEEYRCHGAEFKRQCQNPQSSWRSIAGWNHEIV